MDQLENYVMLYVVKTNIPRNQEECLDTSDLTVFRRKGDVLGVAFCNKEIYDLPPETNETLSIIVK